MPQADEVTLTFSHRYRFEGDYYDGGQVRMSVNGAPFTAVPAASFTLNGYAEGTIVGNGILNGEQAFNGDSSGFDNGDFIQSSAILGTFNQGDSVAVQFVGCWDDCYSPGQPGWVIQGLDLVFGTPAQVATFTAEAAGSRQGAPAEVIYQWQRNDGAGWVNIPGGIGASFGIAPTAADFSALFRVVVSPPYVPGKTLASNEVKLITAVTEPPAIAITPVGNVISIEFTDTLQWAPAAGGPYEDVPDAAESPYEITNPEGALFFRSVR